MSKLINSPVTTDRTRPTRCLLSSPLLPSSSPLLPRAASPLIQATTCCGLQLLTASISARFRSVRSPRVRSEPNLPPLVHPGARGPADCPGERVLTVYSCCSSGGAWERAQGCGHAPCAAPRPITEQHGCCVPVLWEKSLFRDLILR